MRWKAIVFSALRRSSLSKLRRNRRSKRSNLVYGADKLRVGRRFIIAAISMSDHLSEQPRYVGKHSPSLLSPESPGGSPKLQVPSPIVTRRTRTESTSARAFENPVEHGKVKMFSRSKGHGFITSNDSGEDIFVHISDIEGEYVPLPGDEVKYKLCPIPPKYEKNQAINVQIVNLTHEVHLRWDCPVSEEEPVCHGQ